MPSPSTENYLKALLSLADAKGEVNITDLSVALEVSKPAVNGMVKALAAQGLVHYERYRPLTLTSTGRREAALILRKHRLTEMFLVTQMGFGWDEVHEVAEQIEHVDAPKFFARMDELMGHPTVDPHGSPIPDVDGVIAQQDYRPLAETKPGEHVVLRAVVGQEDALFRFLTRKQIGLGTSFEVIEVEGFDGSVRVRYGPEQREESFSLEIGRCLMVG